MTLKIGGKGLLFLGVAGCLAAALVYFFGYRKVAIDDVTKSQEITLQARFPSRHTDSLGVIVSGTIDGTATIETCQRFHGTNTVGPGRVSIRLGGDWYGNECAVSYKPTSVRSGRLTIKYRFFQL